MSSGIVYTRTGRRRTGAVVLALGLVLTVMLALAPHALAIHDLEFQLDGNTVDNAAAAQDNDWETFFDAGSDGNIHAKASLPTDFTAAGFAMSGSPAKGGDYYLPDETVFATGSKDTLNISTGWQCKKANNVGDKVDIVNAYSTVYTDPATGDTILYFGIEKSSPNGDSNVAVWFLQDSAIGCDATGGGNQSFTGNHEDGDLLLVSAFTNGGAQANVAAYAWVGGASGHIDTTPVATGALCGPPGTPDPTLQHACAITNSGAITPPWNHPDKDGGDLNALEFFEGGVNLTDAGILDACFARFLANTRSSQSLTATIFDFATGSLETCAPSTDLTVNASATTIHSGDSVTVTINEENDGINPLTSPSVSVTSNTSENCTTPAKQSGDDVPLGVLDPGETWVYTCTIAPTADLTLTFIGHGTDPRGKDVTWNATDCVGKNEGDISIGGTRVCDPDEIKTVALDVTNPSTDLYAAVTATFTFYEKNDGDVNLTNVTVTGTGCTTSPTLAVDTYNVGDTASPKGTLNVGEIWQYTCSVTRTTSGTSNVSAVGSGYEGTTQITFCAVGNATKICNNFEDAGGSVTLLSSADPKP